MGKKVSSIKCNASYNTWRGERGGGGAFRLRGVVPPCNEEAPEGTCGGCVRMGGGGGGGWDDRQLKTSKSR